MPLNKEKEKEKQPMPNLLFGCCVNWTNWQSDKKRGDACQSLSAQPLEQRNKE